MGIFDRYLLKNFLTPFFYCLLGFVSIWFIFDLSHNLLDYLDGGATISILLDYYRTQVPEILVICLPLSSLLALLYSLTAMSRSNEIISMLGAGRHVMRLLLPLFVVGLVCTGVVTYLNYEAVPHAAVIKKEMLRDIKHKIVNEVGLIGHLYRNREDNRIWYMRRLFPRAQSAEDIQIIQQNADDDIVEQIYAAKAQFDPFTGVWTFFKGMTTTMNAETNDIERKEIFPKIEKKGWSETPWRISSAAMSPDFLSVPELKTYLDHNSDYSDKHLAPYRTQLAYRWALPWVCILVILLAAPLGINYSRRGGVGSAGVAIILFFSMIFISIVAVSFGKGNYISPLAAAWGPFFIFFLLGSYLLWARSGNREIGILGL